MLRFLPVFILVAVLTYMPAAAQPETGTSVNDSPLRIEIPAGSVNETYRVLPCGTAGMILLFRSTEIAGEARTRWYFSLYDTNLLLTWTKNVPLLNNSGLRFSQMDGDTLSLLFLHTGKTRTAESDFEILRIIPQTGTMIVNAGKIRQDAEVMAFGIRNGRAWLAFNVKGQSGKILTTRLDNGLLRSFDLGQGSQISVRWMQADSATPTVTCVVRRQVSKKILEHYLVRYDTAGGIRSEVPVGTKGDGRNLANVRFIFPQPGNGLLLGCYGHDAGTSGQKDKPVDQSTGFFAIQIAGGAQKSAGYYNFLELSSAGSLMSERDILNLKKKALKKNKSLSEYSLDYTVLLHPVFEWQDQYVLVAEVFTPQYHTESFTDFDYYGRPYTNSFSVFDGYRFFNSIIAGFDGSGKLLWDNNCEIRNLVSFELSAKIVVFPSGANLVLCYVSDGKIGSKIIHESKVVEKADFVPIDLKLPDDKLQSESKSRILPWYGNYFITCGYQEIKNIALESDNKRLVFYFSKVRFEE